MRNDELVYARKFGQKTFSGDNAKDAYMKAVKWYATTIISKSHLHGIHVEFQKHDLEPKVTVVLWSSLPEGEVREAHCKICKEVHTVFYSNTGYDCTRCNVLAYLKRLEQKAGIKASYCKEVVARVDKYIIPTAVELERPEAEPEEGDTENA